ncbi:MAG: hypothetical protein LBP79_03080 [Clostridiales bacterium]|jgi:hypothetical protein|nr:hypothetical protein [Clostridiales bacterium]
MRAPFKETFNPFQQYGYSAAESSARRGSGRENVGCLPPNPVRRGFCGRRYPESADTNVCTPFGCKNYTAPPDFSFLEFVDPASHISPRNR